MADALRNTWRVSLDDLMAVVREFLNPTMSRSGLDPCLHWHGAGRLRDLKAKDGTPMHSGLKTYGHGHIHIEVKYPPCMANDTSRGYFFVTIDRTSRRVFIAMYRNKTTATARRFLGDLKRACLILIHTILTCNGKALTDRLFSVRRRAVTRQRAFEMLCSTLGIEYRLIPPRAPQTNGMVERFNGRIEDVLESLHFRSGQELGMTLNRYVRLYNQPLAQSPLGSKTPLHTMKQWHKRKPAIVYQTAILPHGM